MTSILDQYRSKHSVDDFSYDDHKPTEEQLKNREASFVNKLTPKPMKKAEGEEKKTGTILDQYVSKTSENKDELYQKYFKKEPKSAEEFKRMSVSDKLYYLEDMKRGREYLQGAGYTKSLLEAASAGGTTGRRVGGESTISPNKNPSDYTEAPEWLKPQEHEDLKGLGHLVGETISLMRLHKLITKPFQALNGFFGGGRPASYITGYGSAATTGGVLETTKQANKGEFDASEIGVQAMLFGALDSVFRGSADAFNWLKSLKVGQRANILIDGVLPNDLTPNEYKFWEEKVAPELQKGAQQEYKEALQSSVQEAETAFQQEMANVKAAHEKELYELAQNQQLTAEDFASKKRDYENNLKHVAAEHEAKMAQIEKDNQEALQLFQEQQEAFEKSKRRERIVQNALQPQEVEGGRGGRSVSRQGEDVGVRPTPMPETAPTLRNRVGSVVSPNTIESTAPNGRGNTTTAGQNNINAVRANDAVDYQAVNEAYDLSRQLNGQVEIHQPTLVQDLLETQRNLNLIPKRAPPQDQLLNVVDAVLERLVIRSETGAIIGFRPINSNVLAEQAKSLRYFMDFNFEHGNTRGIFSPTVNHLENAIDLGANFTRNDAASEANRNARALYRQWAQDYDNAYIRPYRDTSNFDYSKIFESSLHPDEFNMLNRILERSNASQQAAGVTRRALVEKKLAPFFENPRKAIGQDFDTALRELGAVITQEEESAIRAQFNEARRTPVIVAKKATKAEAPKPPKTKNIEKVEIPLFKEKPKKVAAPDQVKIPTKKEPKVTPQMKAASKIMNAEPEQLMKMADTPSGLKELRSRLSGSDAKKKLFDEIGQRKVKDILYEGNVKRVFKGDELYNIINKSENYSMLSEILGEDVAQELLISAEEIGSKSVTVKMLKNAGMKASYLKTLILMGVL